MGRPRIALLSNPRSTGNIALLPRIRAFCDAHTDIFHYEVEHADQIGEAMAVIARIEPKLLVINGGDGTVQAALTEMYNGDYFSAAVPPVAVLPSGKTNLIALDLGAGGDPVRALERLLELAQHDLAPHIVARELIALTGGMEGSSPVIGMFLGGAGLADIMLYCRHRIYPLGLPNSVSHVITAFAVVLRQVFGMRASFLPPEPSQMSVTTHRAGRVSGRFALMFVTTLEKILLSSDINGGGVRGGVLKFVAVEQKPISLLRAFFASLVGRLGRTKLAGVHIEEADEISIEGESSEVILDGETFRTGIGKPILLRRANPLSFVRIAA
ncbi:MAG: acylglycerol kinase family protein [Sphingomicrobium sp.]